MDRGAVCGRVSMSGIVARQLDGRHGRYLAYFSTNGARTSRVGYIGATLRCLGLGKAGVDSRNANTTVHIRLPSNDALWPTALHAESHQNV
jgi:hypothetical protein